MLDTTADVLIVGGGPAGLAAGIVCARARLRTLVCEKRVLPADKACGEGLMPTGLGLLEKLGAKQHIREGFYSPIEGIRYISAKGRMAAASFREGAGWGIPRLELSRALLQRANELDCLEIRPQAPATRIQWEGQGAHRQIWVNVGEDWVRTRLLVGADGLNSQVRHWAGLQGPRGVHQRWGARQHFKVPPWGREVEIHWGDGAEAYVTPSGEEQVGVAFLWDRRRHSHLPGGDRLVPILLARFPRLQERLQGAARLGPPLAVGPLQRTTLGQVADGMLLLGDAAGYLDALTGEGLSLALAQALSLEETVVPRLQDPGHMDPLSIQDLSGYREAYRAIVRPYYQVTHLVLWLSRHPRLAELTIVLLGQRPDLFQSLLSANMGVLPLWQVPLGGRGR